MNGPVFTLAPAPVFIIAPPRSFTSVACAMIGQHPQMYGLPETHLFVSETMREWWLLCCQTDFPMAHGLLRAVAQLYFGGQTDDTIMLAADWIGKRLHFTTGMMFASLAEQISPKIIIEKSPAIVYRLEHLQRLLRTYPRAKFLHLVRHPRGFCEAVVNTIRKTQETAPAPPWMLYMASCPQEPTIEVWTKQYVVPFDPQNAWLFFHRNICTFLGGVPEQQKLTLRSEELLTDPDGSLRRVSNWMGICADFEAIEKMKRPQESPYAIPGPRAAAYGNDPNFLDRPILRPERARVLNLEGNLSWRPDGEGFMPEVKRLAGYFGYV
jgi:hypothetical protein